MAEDGPTRKFSATRLEGQLVRDHVRDERQRRVGGRERRHDLAGVRRDLASQERHGARHLGLGDESHDAELREAAVIDLRAQALLLGLSRLVLGEAERVEEVEWDRVGEDALDRRKLARDTALHVVGRARLLEDVRALAASLEEADEEKDLHLRRRGERVPLRRWAARSRDVGVRDAAGGERPRPVDAVGLHNVANESGHGHAAVLDLSLAEEANGRLLADRELVVVDEVHRVPEADHRVELSGERLEVGLGLHGDRSAGRRRDRRNRGGERSSSGVEREHD